MSKRVSDSSWIVMLLGGLAGLFGGGVAGEAVEPARAPLDKLVALYAPMQETLSGDSVAAVTDQAAKVAAEAAAAVAAGGDRPALEAVVTAAKGMTALEIHGLREQFKPLSLALAYLVEKQAVMGFGIYYCPMADAYWIQKNGEVRNPYFGQKMPTCGESVTKVDG